MTSYSSKGQGGPSYPLTIEVRWPPNLSLFKFEFIPHLDTFLFEMQNVTAACSTILFNYLKGKFSSGREGALASKFNYDFK